MVFGDLTAVQLQPEQRSEVEKWTAHTCGQLGAFESEPWRDHRQMQTFLYLKKYKKNNKTPQKMCRLKSQEIQPSTISSTSTQHSGTVCVSSGWLLSVVGGGDLSTCVCVCVCARARWSVEDRHLAGPAISH